VGKGAMGLVYEARDPNLDRRVAIKTIKVENLSTEEAADYEVRFRTEARSAARLQHPHIVSVYDSDRDGDTAYLVMEFIEGQDIKQHLDQGVVFSLDQTLSIMGDLLSALDYAHKQNIVHRDIKPANLLLQAGGAVKLSDFGVARIQDSGDATRTQGSMVGTLKYMAPEQLQGRPVDSRADLFAAGVVLYQLLTGQRPFDGASDFDIIQQIVSLPHDPPSRLMPGLPGAMDAVVARALAKSRDERFATAAEFNTALRAAASDAQDRTIAPPPQQPSKVRSSTWSGTLQTDPAQGSSPGGVPGSTVTQEVELVYWKDVKDSDDTGDLQEFLAKFPNGIYADLARRRLKKLMTSTGTGASEDATVRYPGASTATAAPTQPQPVARPPLQAAPAVESAETPPPVTVPTPPRRAPLYLAAALIAAAGLGFVASLVFEEKSRMADVAATGSVAAPPAPAGSGTTPSTSAPVAAAVPTAPTVSTQMVTPAPLLGVPVSTPARIVATVPKPMKPVAAHPAHLEPAAPPPTETASALRVPANEPTPARTGQAASTPSVPPGPDPRTACEGKPYVLFEVCMSFQCLRPELRRHPECLKRFSRDQKGDGN